MVLRNSSFTRFRVHVQRTLRPWEWQEWCVYTFPYPLPRTKDISLLCLNFWISWEVDSFVANSWLLIFFDVSFLLVDIFSVCEFWNVTDVIVELPEEHKSLAEKRVDLKAPGKRSLDCYGPVGPFDFTFEIGCLENRRFFFCAVFCCCPDI